MQYSKSAIELKVCISSVILFSWVASSILWHGSESWRANLPMNHLTVSLSVQPFYLRLHFKSARVWWQGMHGYISYPCQNCRHWKLVLALHLVNLEVISDVQNRLDTARCEKEVVPALLTRRVSGRIDQIKSNSEKFKRIGFVKIRSVVSPNATLDWMHMLLAHFNSRLRSRSYPPPSYKLYLLSALVFTHMLEQCQFAGDKTGQVSHWN